MFASQELARRLEQAECALLNRAAQAGRERSRTAVRTIAVAGGLAVHAGADSPLTKVAGLGFAEGPDDRAWAEVEQLFASRATPVQVELAALADPEWGAFLTARGYVLRGFENVLGVPLPLAAAAPQPDAGLVVEESSPDGFGVWLDTVVSGFIHPDTQGLASHEEFPREALERVIGDMASAEGFRRFLARRDGRPAGGASMHVTDGVAALCGASTLPEHRRRGVQTQLVHQRLAAAAAAGCELGVTTTLPGSKSQENAQRLGFAVLYTRAILIRDVRKRHP
jgi:GNAT superfamily N-acetyltransferase